MATRKKEIRRMVKSKRLQKAVGPNNSFYGKHHSEAWKKQERRRKQGKNNPMFGRKHSASTIRKMRQSMLKRLAKKRR